MDYLQYENYLAHYGVVGMKWGVRRYQNAYGSLTAAGRRRSKKYDEYGNKRKGSKLFAIPKAMLKPMTKTLSMDPAHTNEIIDDANIKYETKYMTDNQKKLYSLNYYNDRKTVSSQQGKEARDYLNKMDSTNKTRSEQFNIDLMGSDFIREMSTIQIETADKMYNHYSKKVDDMLNDMGDIKLGTIQSKRSVVSGNTVYTWNGVEYVEQDK